jgi:hypothetical protein
MTKASIHRFDIFTPSDSVSWVSNEQRQFLQKEGVAYILRYGPSKQHASWVESKRLILCDDDVL